MRTITMAALGFGLVAILAAGCRREARPGAAPGFFEGREEIRLATTTSTENSGLLAVLLPPFERQAGVRVSVIAVGTGKALELGRGGDVDAVLVHARSREDAFVERGHGVNRRDVMHNDFVVLGPPDDPAGIGGGRDAAEALRALAGAGALFVSRGDDSGTHTKERALWKAAGVAPRGEAWYDEAGQGMAAVLRIADEKRGYTLSDRGTYLALRGTLDLAVLVEGDDRLFNPYGVIAVNPARHEGVNYRGAMALIGWLTSPEGQALIANYRKEGEALFHADAVPAK